MAQDGVFKEDLTVDAIAFMYREFLDGYGTEGEGFDEGDAVAPDFTIRSESPIIWGNGPIEFSTCTAVGRVYPPDFVWDAEGYYRTLGVGHLATRRDIKRAFLAANGHDSERLTFIVKMLLNPEMRYEYDMLPLGGRFIEDPDVQDEIKRNAFLEAMRLREQGHYTTGEAILAEWGFSYVDEVGQEWLNEQSSDEPLSEAELADQDGLVRNTWCYAFYLWRTTNLDAPLGQWQEALISAASQLGVVEKIAVGVIGNVDSDYVIENIHGHKVVLIRDGQEPSNSLAIQAITDLTQLT